MNEIDKIVSHSISGIKSTRFVRKVSNERFSDTGEFCTVEENKKFSRTKGITIERVESISYFDCLHLATPEGYGGACCLGTIVCRNCLVQCAENNCSNMVCLCKECRCGGRKDGKLYCWKHGGAGLIGFLSILFKQP